MSPMPLHQRRRRHLDRHLDRHLHRGVMSTVAAVLSAGLAMSACNVQIDHASPPPVTREVGTPTAPVTSEPTTAPTGYSIKWEAVDDRTDRGRIVVPVDYANPAGPTMELEVARHRAPADTRIGVLASNNGGPGLAASSLALNASAYFPSEITDRFDIVSWDPRGTGASGGSVDCIKDDQYDRFFVSPDLTPATDDERKQLVDLAKEFAADCVGNDAEITSIGTNNSARDLDAIRQALDEQQLSYFGFSYGSELGGVWSTLFPATVRAAVFDGAIDPNADSTESARQQEVGFEAALDRFLATCSADKGCAFYNGGDAAGAFDALMARLDKEPIPSVEGRPKVNRDVAATAVIWSMYSDQYWPALERALEDAANGDGAGLLQLADAYYRRAPDGSYSNLLEAFQAISCMDDPKRPTVSESDAEAAELAAAGPRLFLRSVGSYFCTFFPPAPEKRVEITGIGAGPIVVIGTTGDPATPLDGSRAMAAALEDGRLVVVTANQHTGYGANQCVQDIVASYLVDLIAPADETTCP